MMYTKKVSLSVNEEIDCIHHQLRVFFCTSRTWLMVLMNRTERFKSHTHVGCKNRRHLALN